MFERMTDQEVLDRSKKSSSAYEMAAYVDEMKKRGIYQDPTPVQQQVQAPVPMATTEAPTAPVTGIAPQAPIPAMEIKPAIPRPMPSQIASGMKNVEQAFTQEAEQAGQIGAQATQAKADIEGTAAEFKRQMFDVYSEIEQEKRMQHAENEAKYIADNMPKERPQGWLKDTLGFIGMALSGKQFPVVVDALTKAAEAKALKISKLAEAYPEYKGLTVENMLALSEVDSHAFAKQMLASGKIEQSLALEKLAKAIAAKKLELRKNTVTQMYNKQESGYKQSISEAVPVAQGTKVKTSSVRDVGQKQLLVPVPREKDSSYTTSGTAEEVKQFNKERNIAIKLIDKLYKQQEVAKKLAADWTSPLFNKRLVFDKWRVEGLDSTITMILKEMENLGVLQNLDISWLQPQKMYKGNEVLVTPQMIDQQFGTIINDINDEMINKASAIGITNPDPRLWMPESVIKKSTAPKQTIAPKGKK